MSPRIEPGSLVCIDSHQRDPKLLGDQIVAMRNDEGGCTLRYLRLEKKFLLGIPENIREYNPLVFTYREKRTSDKNPIVGKIVWFWSLLEEN